MISAAERKLYIEQIINAIDHPGWPGSVKWLREHDCIMPERIFEALRPTIEMALKFKEADRRLDIAIDWIAKSDWHAASAARILNQIDIPYEGEKNGNTRVEEGESRTDR